MRNKEAKLTFGLIYYILLSNSVFTWLEFGFLDRHVLQQGQSLNKARKGHYAQQENDRFVGSGAGKLHRSNGRSERKPQLARANSIPARIARGVGKS